MTAFLIISALSCNAPVLKAKAVTDEVSTPKRITSADILIRVASKLGKNTHYKVIGACIWLRRWHSPKVTLEVEHFLPDLLVTVYKRPSTNPWQEAHTLLHNKMAIKGYEKAFRAYTGNGVSYGANSSSVTDENTHMKRPLVDVYGSPSVLARLPFLSLSPDTYPFKPYYIALTDLVQSRLMLIELTLMASKLGDVKGMVSGFPVGTTLSHWGYELPRHFIINNANNFKGSVVAAMQGADLVSNYNLGHTAISLSNSCGRNCVVSNVVYDEKGKNIKWQEIYPTNRMITPGVNNTEEDKKGLQDDKKGNGNYVFVVWRKYRGCIQGRGKLIYKTKNVGSPKKR